MATQIKTKAEAFYLAAENLFANLYARWQDEKEYEDLTDYAAVVQTVADKHGVKITQICSVPFGCKFIVDGKLYRVKINQRSYSYVRIG